MSEAIYGPYWMHWLTTQSKRLQQLEQAVSVYGTTFAQLIQAVLLLVGAGHLSLAQDEFAITSARRHSDKINAHLLNKARGASDVSYLASPVTGGGVVAGRFQQLFILAMRQDGKQSVEWAQYAWSILSAQGQKLVKDSRTLESDEECLAELTQQAQTFAEKHVPILKALQLI